jgi:hypothetical protein
MSEEQTPSEALDGVPAVFKLPASKASLAQNRFRFQLPDEDHVRSIPKLKFLKPSVAVKIETMALQEAVIELFTMYEPDLLDRLDGLDQLEVFTQAWAEASGIALGESKPSSDSSENTEGL